MVAHAFSDAVIADGATYWQKYQEASGTTFVDSIAGLTATAVGAGITAAAAGPGAAAPWDKAVSSTGAASYLSTPDNALFSVGLGAAGRSMSFETIRSVSRFDPTLNWLFAKSGNGSNYEHWCYLTTAGALDWGVALDGNAVNYIDVRSADSLISLNTWFHAVFTVEMKPGASPTRAYVYLNGVQVAGPGTPTTPGNSFGGDENSPWLSGYRGDNTYNPYAGKIAADLVYPTALSGAQALAHYNAWQADLAGPPPWTLTPGRTYDVSAAKLNTKYTSTGGLGLYNKWYADYVVAAGYNWSKLRAFYAAQLTANSISYATNAQVADLAALYWGYVTL